MVSAVVAGRFLWWQLIRALAAEVAAAPAKHAARLCQIPRGVVMCAAALRPVHTVCHEEEVVGGMGIR